MSGFNYHRYLASREWSVLRNQVRERAQGCCERCVAGHREMAAVHHLTYERVGRELLADLQAVCVGCHAYVHGHSDTDPAVESLAQWLELVA